MSALDYLRSLQGDIDKTMEPPEWIKIHREEQLKNDPLLREAYQSTRMSIADFEVHIKNHLVNPILQVMDVSESSKLMSVPVGLLPTFDPNAWALRTPSGEHVVVLHWALLTLVSLYKETQFACFRAPEQAAIIESQCHDYIACAFNATSVSTVPPPIPFQLSPEDFISAQIMACAGEIFIIAHELAHIVLGHTGQYITIPLKLKGKQEQVEKLNPRQQQELDADCQAIKWICQFDRKSSNPIVHFAAHAPSLAAEVLMMIHFVEKSLGTAPSPSSSHPSAIQRLQNIHQKCAHLMDKEDVENFSQWIATATKE